MLARGWSLLGVMLILVVSFAGCLGDEDVPDTANDAGTDAGDAETGDTGSTGGSGDPTTDGGDAVGEPPVAKFSIAEDKLTAGANITFNASASSDPDGTNLTYSWDFGDNETGDGIEVVHVYAEPGNYTVVLNVTDEEGRSAISNQTVFVEPGAAAEFTETLSGSIAVPHPALTLTPGGSDLDTYKQRGAAEGTTYVLHEVTDVPTEVQTVSFSLSTSAQYVQYVIFDGEGNQLALRNFPTGASKATLGEENAGHGHYFVFVYSAVTPNASYTIDVTVA